MSVGLEGPALLDRAGQQAVAAALSEATDEAHAASVFGPPTWVVDDEHLWQQDRLDFLEKALGD